MATTFDPGLVPNMNVAAAAAGTAIPEDEGGAPLTGPTHVGTGGPSVVVKTLRVLGSF